LQYRRAEAASDASQDNLVELTEAREPSRLAKKFRYPQRKEFIEKWVRKEGSGAWIVTRLFMKTLHCHAVYLLWGTILTNSAVGRSQYAADAGFEGFLIVPLKANILNNSV
jgi:hypothetical protein